MRYLKTLEKFGFKASIGGMVEKYLRDCSFHIDTDFGNCAFFAKDFCLWADKNNIDCKLVYFPQSPEFVKCDEVEDHIIPMVDGDLIDFVYTPYGVSRRVRKSNRDESIRRQLNPEITPLSEFKEKYGKFGYETYEILSYAQAFLGKEPRCQTYERPRRRF